MFEAAPHPPDRRRDITRPAARSGRQDGQQVAHCLAAVLRKAGRRHAARQARIAAWGSGPSQTGVSRPVGRALADRGGPLDAGLPGDVRRWLELAAETDDVVRMAVNET